MTAKKAAKKAAVQPKEQIRGAVPNGVGPVEPIDAGSTTPRTVPPLYPDGYTVDRQPNAPEVPYPGNGQGIPGSGPEEPEEEPEEG